MPFPAQTTMVRTRFAALSPGAALAMFGALLVLIGVGLVLPPTAEPGGAPRGGDAALYRQIAARVAHGENYYHAAAIEQRASQYPLKPFTAVRSPVLAEVAGRVGPSGADLLLRLLAVAATIGTVMRLAPQLSAPFRECAILLSATAAGIVMQPGMWVWHEIWAGLLIALALACRTERHWYVSVALGLAAVLLRELAFPFLLIMAGTAWAGGGWREARAWLLATAIAVAFFLAHKAAVEAIALPNDVTSPGWGAFGGWRFDLALARQSSFLLIFPPWAAAVATPLALLGWCARPGGYAIRTAAILCLWMGTFLIFGRPDNSYWGYLLAPLLPVGLALAPPALRDLACAARQMSARGAPVSTP